MKLTGLKSLWVDWSVQDQIDVANRAIRKAQRELTQATEQRDAYVDALPTVIQEEKDEVLAADEAAAKDAAIEVNR